MHVCVQAHLHIWDVFPECGTRWRVSGITFRKNAFCGRPHYPGAHQEWLATHWGSFVFGSDSKLAPPCLAFSMGAGKGVLDTLQRQLLPCQQPPTSPSMVSAHSSLDLPTLLHQHSALFLTLQMTENPTKTGSEETQIYWKKKKKTKPITWLLPWK